MKNSKTAADVKLLGPCGTFMTLMKGFICTGILYLPNAVLKGGWGFSAVMLIFSACFTYYCSLLLLEVRKKINANSYTECGSKIFGIKGKRLVNLALASS